MVVKVETFTVVEGIAQERTDGTYFIAFDCPYCGAHSLQDASFDGETTRLTEYFSVNCADEERDVFLVHWE